MPFIAVIAPFKEYATTVAGSVDAKDGSKTFA